MSRTVQITFDCHDPYAQARFWADVLEYDIPGPPGIELDDDEDVFEVWEQFVSRLGIEMKPEDRRAAIEDPHGVGPRVFFQIVPEGKTVKNRVHLDVRAAPGLEGAARMEALEAECARLEAFGATRLSRTEPAPPLEHGVIVMTDPEGNEFCLD